MMNEIRISYVVFFLLLELGNGMAGEKHQPTLNKGAEESTCIGDLRKSKMDSGFLLPALPQKRISFWGSKGSLAAESGKDASEHTKWSRFSANPVPLQGKRNFRSPGIPLKTPFPAVM